MLGKRLYTFSQFIVERADRAVGAYYLNKLRAIGDSEVIEALDRVSESLNYLEDKYWYGREGGRAHYALNMKIHAYPDLEEWAKARGEEDLDDVDEEMMYEDLARFMEDTYEIHAEDYKESFSWIKEVGVGGKNGGWLLIYPETTHDNIEDDAGYAMEDYLNYLSEESDIELIKDIINNPDIKELASMGLINTEDVANAEEALASRKDLLELTAKQITELDEISQDLEMITSEIKNFKEKAETLFYEWVREYSA
jgi:hypothetical protein